MKLITDLQRRIHVTKPDLIGQGLAELAGNISFIIFSINEGWHIAELSYFANLVNLSVVYENKILTGTFPWPSYIYLSALMCVEA